MIRLQAAENIKQMTPNMKPAPYLLIAINCRYTHSCLALYYVRNELELHIPGCRTIIKQFTLNEPYYHTLLAITKLEAQALFFSVYIWNATLVERLLGDLAQLQPNRPLILGGPQAPFLHTLPASCTIVQGEIEGVSPEFYTDLAHGHLQPYYQAAAGHAFAMPYRPEDFSDLRHRHLYYESSRGCPFSCSYCLSSVKRGVCHQDIDSVQKELTTILATEPELIKFVDRTFNDNPNRTLAIWRFLADRHENTRYHFEIAPDRFTEEMLEFLSTVKPDLFQFEMGIQSCHPPTLTAIRRHMDVETAAANIQRLAEFDNIHLHVDLILGLPRESVDSFRHSFNQVFRMSPHYIQMGLLKILPETSIRQEATQHGLLFCLEPPYEILATSDLSHQELSTLHEFGECVEAFYNNRYFRSLWNYLWKKHEEPFAFFRELQNCCIHHNFFGLAHTQLLMARILTDFAAGRPDHHLFLELLRHDWLRAGNRFLPDFLETQNQAEIRTELRLLLPQSLPGCFTHKNRNEFLKQGLFLPLSGAALQELGLQKTGEDGYLCFLPEKSAGVMNLQKVLLLNERTITEINTPDTRTPLPPAQEGKRP